MDNAKMLIGSIKYHSVPCAPLVHDRLAFLELGVHFFVGEASIEGSVCSEVVCKLFWFELRVFDWRGYLCKKYIPQWRPKNGPLKDLVGNDKRIAVRPLDGYSGKARRLVIPKEMDHCRIESSLLQSD